MKKFLTGILCGILTLSLVACGSNNDETESNSNTNSSNDTTKNEETDLSNSEKVLVVYFSMPETTDPDNMTQEEDNSVVVIDGEVLGNTQYVANVIQTNTAGDLFRIEPATPYPTDHETLVDLAKEEQNDDSRPEIKDQIENFEEYDTIFVGYPNWWGDMPMIMIFLEKQLFRLTHMVEAVFLTQLIQFQS